MEDKFQYQCQSCECVGELDEYHESLKCPQCDGAMLPLNTPDKPAPYTLEEDDTIAIPRGTAPEKNKNIKVAKAVDLGFGGILSASTSTGKYSPAAMTATGRHVPASSNNSSFQQPQPFTQPPPFQPPPPSGLDAGGSASQAQQPAPPPAAPASSPIAQQPVPSQPPQATQRAKKSSKKTFSLSKKSTPKGASTSQSTPSQSTGGGGGAGLKLQKKGGAGKKKKKKRPAQPMATGKYSPASRSSASFQTPEASRTQSAFPSAHLAADVPKVEPDLQSAAIDQAAKFAALQAELEAERQARLDAERRAAEEKVRTAEFALEEEKKKREEAEQLAREAAEKATREARRLERERMEGVGTEGKPSGEEPKGLTPKKKKPPVSAAKTSVGQQKRKPERSSPGAKPPGGEKKGMERKKAGQQPGGSPDKKKKSGPPGAQGKKTTAGKKPGATRAPGAAGKSKRPEPGSTRAPGAAGKSKRSEPGATRAPGKKGAGAAAPVTPALNALKPKTRIGELVFDEDEELHPELLKIHQQKKVLIRTLAIAASILFCIVFAVIYYMATGAGSSKRSSRGIQTTRKNMNSVYANGGGGGSGTTKRGKNYSPLKGEYTSIRSKIRHLKPQSAEAYDEAIKLWTDFVNKHKDASEDVNVKKAKEEIARLEDIKKMYVK